MPHVEFKYIFKALSVGTRPHTDGRTDMQLHTAFTYCVTLSYTPNTVAVSRFLSVSRKEGLTAARILNKILYLSTHLYLD